MLFVIRHGVTGYNRTDNPAEERFRGRVDVPLAEEGRDQAKAAALSLLGIAIDKVYYSPMIRSEETAEIIKQEYENLGGNVLVPQCLVDPGLKPWDIGYLEGQLVQPNLKKIFEMYEDQNLRPEGGETYGEFKARVLANIRDLLAEQTERRHIVAVSHSSTQRTLAAWIAAGAKDDTVDVAQLKDENKYEYLAPGAIMALDLEPQTYKPRMVPRAQALGETNRGFGSDLRQEAPSPA